MTDRARDVEARALELLRHESRNRSPAELLAWLASLVDATAAELTPRESEALARQTRKQQMLEDLTWFKQEHPDRAHDAAIKIARRHARDPLDPVEVNSTAHKLRRWERESKKKDSVRPRVPKRGN